MKQDVATLWQVTLGSGLGLAQLAVLLGANSFEGSLELPQSRRRTSQASKVLEQKRYWRGTKYLSKTNLRLNLLVLKRETETDRIEATLYTSTVRSWSRTYGSFDGWSCLLEWSLDVFAIVIEIGLFIQFSTRQFASRHPKS